MLPAVLVLGLGFATVVAPMASTALSSAPAEHAGLASGVDNAVASLVAIAVVPAAAGIGGEDYADPAALGQGFATALVIAAAVVAAGGLLAGHPASAATAGAGPHRCPDGSPGRAQGHLSHCAVGSPPLVTITGRAPRTVAHRPAATRPVPGPPEEPWGGASPRGGRGR